MSSRNLFAQWRAMFARGPRQVGHVIAYDQGVATVELPSGARVAALGDASVDDTVYIRDGVIEGPAPDLPVDTATI